MDSYVKKNCPADSSLDQLISYHLMMIQKCESFEASIAQYCDKNFKNDSNLSESLREALEALGENLSKIYFQRVISLIKEENLNNVMVGSKNRSTEDSVYFFPQCCIHSNVLDMFDIVNDIFVEISKTKALRLKNSLSKTIRSILDIYRAHLILKHYKNENLTPHLLMVYHNDCQYIAHKCQIWLLKEFNLKETNHTIVDLVAQFRDLSLLFFNDAVKTQQFILKDILKEMGGLQCEAEERYLKLQRVLKKVVFQVKHVSKIWKVNMVFN